MTLREAQRAFVRNVGGLISYAYSQGWEMSFGDAWRPDRDGHVKDSLHYERLAIDLNLFVDGVYIEKDHPAWRALGCFWKGLHPLNRWGGDILPKCDYNHFSAVADADDDRI